MNKPIRLSYILSFVFLILLLVLVTWLKLATPLLTVLFSYFALCKLHISERKWVAIALFAILVSGIFYGFVHFISQARETLPNLADKSIPSIKEFALRHGLELPFTDRDSLNELIRENVKDQLRPLVNFAKIATKEFVFVLIGFVVAVSMFVNPQVDLDCGKYAIKHNLYTVCWDEVAARFRAFYHSFALVMGAQITISLINTILTAIFALSVTLPYGAVVIGVTFLCGLLPIVGNLISNSVIVAIGFTKSPQMAIGALVFLIALHKLEYFLNSKIIGDRIKNPVWLTLLGLILGERLMGIPGMILAPVILKYIKLETTQIEVAKSPEAPLSTANAAQQPTAIEELRNP